MAKVLLVEDDLIVQRVHHIMLTKLGCQVDIVASGNQAIEKINQHDDYQIIFVDIGLPDISGFDLIKKIRHLNSSYAKEIPVIALTGYAGPIETQACFDAGASDVAYKPIVNNALRELIIKWGAQLPTKPTT